MPIDESGAIRGADGLDVRLLRGETVVYDSEGKPYLYIKRNGTVAVRCFEGDVRFRAAMNEGGRIESPDNAPRNNPNTGLRAVVLAGRAAEVWPMADFDALRAGSTRAFPKLP